MLANSARCLLPVVALLLWVPATPAQSQSPTLIKAGKLIDPSSGKALTQQSILIRGGIVEAVGPGLTVPPNATVIDLSGATVMPGLIDCHVHITGEAGAASIEHGSLIDDKGIELMKRHGTYLVADVYNDDYIVAEYQKMGFPAHVIEKEKLVGRRQRENFRKAVKAGVKVAFGTDAGVYPHGGNGRQFRYMVEWGMTPMQAIQSATVGAADLLGWQEKAGIIAAGRAADIIAVPGDPLVDVTVLEKVGFVMKDGIVYRNSLLK